jgi:putative flavoprotein involved in K+ transport
MPLPRHISTVVIGAGHAGLIMSRHLSRAGMDHIVLERRATPGGGWQDRWDGFRLVTPNWTSALPDLPYDGTDPDGYMTRDEIVARVASYASCVAAPVSYETVVERLAPKESGGFHLQTSAGPLDADQVIVATGSYHVPRVPAFAAALPDGIHALHSHDYHNPSDLPPGAVLVVGSGQTGVQLADELERAGRRVMLSVGSNATAPRRYRGRDIFYWLWRMAGDGERYGAPMPTVETLPDPRMRLMGTPQLSGHHGGQDVNLRRMADEGHVTLLGHVAGIEGTRLVLEPGIAARLARADAFFDERLRPNIDTFIAKAGIDAPADDRSPYSYDPPDVADVDLRAQGVSSIVWATGFRMDHSWIEAPVDDQGFPRHERGVSTELPGLYFIGLLWQHNQASATLFGPNLDGPYIAQRMGLTVDPEEWRQAFS